MNFWEIFWRVLPHRPKPALAAVYWHLTRRRVRARNRLRVAAADLPFAYDLWIASKERIASLAERSGREMDGWKSRPRFTVFLHSTEDLAAEELARSVRSVERQIYPEWTLSSAVEDPLEERLSCATGEFVVPLHVGDELSEAALFRLAEALQVDEQAKILYGDHDELDDQDRRTRPWFKPRWNEEMFLAQDYLSGALAIQTRLARRCGCRTLSELLISAVPQAGEAIIHVPHVLAHLRHRNEFQDRRLRAVASHVEQRGATCGAGPFGTVKVEWPLPDDLPLVSIIIPTKDKLHLLRPCIESIFDRTEYDAIEIIIVDNGSVDKRTAEYLGGLQRSSRARILEYPGPYNFSAINNFAVSQASGDYVCLLNNDTEIVERTWLTELMRQAVRPMVGAVGAKLLYEDRSIQHAGVVVGIGEAAGHAHRFLPEDEPGYFCQAHISRFVSAVTAACLVVDKGKYLSVGGLDEEAFPVAFNDVDFCLRLEQAGWNNVYVPHAVLLHHESVSRGADTSPLNIERYRGELRRLQARWRTKTYQDPSHNPNLDRYTETFVLNL